MTLPKYRCFNSGGRDFARSHDIRHQIILALLYIVPRLTVLSLSSLLSTDSDIHERRESLSDNSVVLTTAKRPSK